MKYGINLPVRGPLAGPESMTRLATSAEHWGYEHVAVSDHIVIPKVETTNYPYDPGGRFNWEANANWFDPLTALTWMAAHTSRLRLGTSVLIVTYRNPVHTAKVLASLDALSGGRAFLGVGTGWWLDEYRALGLEDQYPERGPRTDEHIRIFRNLWTAAEPAYEGPYHRYANLDFSPKPVQPGGLPIWIGGHTKRALRRTAELGDVWHPIGLRAPVGLPPAELGRSRDTLRGLCEAQGRDPESIGIAFRCPVVFSTTERDWMTGSPEQIAEDIRAYRAQGITSLTCNFNESSLDHLLEQMQRMAEEVFPLTD